jgi:hypothetical protein
MGTEAHPSELALIHQLLQAYGVFLPGSVAITATPPENCEDTSERQERTPSCASFKRSSALR